jgi:predicted AAA+ superfamily ATPase
VLAAGEARGIGITPKTLIQRDIRDLARISALDALPRLLTMAAGSTAGLVNISELASPFQISRQTIPRLPDASDRGSFWSMSCDPGSTTG